MKLPPIAMMDERQILPIQRHSQATSDGVVDQEAQALDDVIIGAWLSCYP